MSTPTSALTAEYKKVIPAKFVTKRDGKPMACMTCGNDLVMGASYAATNGDGWVSYCSACASSPLAQVAGLVSRVEALVAPLGDDVPTEVTTLVLAASPLIGTVLGGDTTNWLGAKRLLLSIREQVGIANKNQRAIAAADAQVNDPLYQALKAVAGGLNCRDAANANSLLDGWNRFGSLTERQQAWAEKLTAPAAPPVANGLYVCTLDGVIRKVYTTQNGNAGVKRLSVINGKGSFNYEKGGVAIVRGGLASGAVRILTQAEAQAFGRQYSFCVNCAITLTDDRSLAAGYGETCAGNNGWFYPNKAEAAEMLARPAGVLMAPPAGPAVNLPAPVSPQQERAEYEARAEFGLN
jgi:hypothetical protein